MENVLCTCTGSAKNWPIDLTQCNAPGLPEGLEMSEGLVKTRHGNKASIITLQTISLNQHIVHGHLQTMKVVNFAHSHQSPITKPCVQPATWIRAPANLRPVDQSGTLLLNWDISKDREKQSRSCCMTVELLHIMRMTLAIGHLSSCISMWVIPHLYKITIFHS